MMHEYMDKVVGAARAEIQAEIGRRLAGAGLSLEAGEGEKVEMLALPPAKEGN